MLTNSDQALPGSPKEILAIRTRLLHRPRIVVEFNVHFMKYQFHSDLWSVSPLDEDPRPLGESGVRILLGLLFHERAGFRLARVFTKLDSG